MKEDRDIDKVARTLDIALEHGMAAEVWWSSLVMAAEANEHGRTMEEVLEAALGEWDLLPLPTFESKMEEMKKYPHQDNHMD